MTDAVRISGTLKIDFQQNIVCSIVPGESEKLKFGYLTISFCVLR